MEQLRRLIPYLRRHKKALWVGSFFMALGVCCQLTIPKVAGWTIDRISTADITESGLLLAGGIIAGVALLRVSFTFTGRYFMLSSSRRIEAELRNEMYAHLTTLSAKYFDRNTTGDITSRTINDVEGVRMMVGPALMTVWSTLLLFTGCLVSMFLLLPDVAALCLGPLLLISVVMIWVGTKAHRIQKAVQDQLGVISGMAQENFSGSRVVRAFVQEENEIDRFNQECGVYRDRSVRLAKWRARAMALIMVLWELAIAIFLFLGGSAVVDARFTMGQFLEFVAYQWLLLWPMIAIGWVVNMTYRGTACLRRMTEVLDTPAETRDSAGVRSGDPIRGAVEARGLTFSFDPDRAPALVDLSFKIAPGEKVAVVGRTGSGKSTLVQLLLRLYKVPDEMLFIDGRDINTIPIAELRSAIGTVPQDLFLFSEKIRDNIAFGGLNGVAEEEVLRAAEISRLSEDVQKFPDRYDQLIGERGVTLSGGQRQRTALARAIVRGPKILLLDDALSSVDSHTEREIEERLREYMKGRTSLVITHRLSEIADADRILVLESGRLVEQGRHDDLVARGGVYAGLWESQKLAEELSGS